MVAILLQREFINKNVSNKRVPQSGYGRSDVAA